MNPPFLQRMMESLAAEGRTSFGLRLPGGESLHAGNGPPRFTLVVHSDAVMMDILLRGHMGLLEAYFDQAVDIEGDFAAAFAAGMAAGFDTRLNPIGRLENGLHELRHSNRHVAQARGNARAHYGLPEAFYRLWLDDPLKMYTCAYWSEGTRTLEEAQRNKIDQVCRKIRLGHEDRFLDLGCGFGGFMRRAVQTTGARGVGLNTASEQVAWLRAELAREGLDGMLSVRETDFRDVDGPYDKLVSIGVLEHAGRDQLGAMIQAHADALAPGGLGLIHFIGHVGRHDTDLFIRKHVFPGGWIPSLADVIVLMERCGLEVVDIENLRRHYALTLDEWARRFDAQWPRIEALDPRRFDERFRRIWRSYLVGCAEMFRSPASYTHLFQIVFSKGNLAMRGYPMSRAFLYG